MIFFILTPSTFLNISIQSGMNPCQSHYHLISRKACKWHGGSTGDSMKPGSKEVILKKDSKRIWMKNMSFGIKYIIGRQIFKKHTPLIAGLAITNKCNLRCRHCRVIERKTEDMSFEKITSILDSFYK